MALCVPLLSSYGGSSIVKVQWSRDEGAYEVPMVFRIAGCGENSNKELTPLVQSKPKLWELALEGVQLL